MNRKLLGESLVEAGVITIEQLNAALVLRAQKFPSEKIGRILVSMNYIDEDTLIQFLARQYGTPGINFSTNVADRKAVKTIPPEFAKRYKAVPIGFRTNKKTTKLIVAMADPSNLEAIDAIAFIAGYDIEPAFAREEDLKWVFRENYYYQTGMNSKS